jgi:hemerythrin-like domain-containing protein
MPATPACDLLREEHRSIGDCLNWLLSRAKKLRATDVPALRPQVDLLRRSLATHFQREERVLFPALRPHCPSLLARMQDQHDYIRAVEAELAGMLAETPAAPTRAWISDLRSWLLEFCERIRNHASDEDEQLFRVAAACLRSDQQLRIARRMSAIGTD